MRVLLAEDHHIVRQGTRLYLESRGVDIIGEATNGREAVEMALSLQPDVVLMDVHMPEITGIEATRRIHHERDDIRILILTAYDEPAYVHALLDAGADGFVLKTAALDDLYSALEEVAGGRKAFSEETLKRAGAHDLPTQAEGLTDREIEVLGLAGQGLTNKEIGKKLFISDRTVQGHLRNIYEKLNVSTRTEAVTVALQYGMIRLGGEA